MPMGHNTQYCEGASFAKCSVEISIKIPAGFLYKWEICF